MTNITTKPDSSQPAAEMAIDPFDNWFDPIETEVRARAHEFIEELIRGELDAVLARPRYGRSQMDDLHESLLEGWQAAWVFLNTHPLVRMMPRDGGI